jgi:hypothetical protein
MSKAKTGPIEQFGGEVEALAGAAVRAEVMVGAESITTKTSGADIARWVKGAVERLEILTPPGTAIRVMENCGANCARVNHAVIARTVARRQKYPTEEAFLAAEVKKPMTGTRLARQGNVLHQFYTPRSYGRGMRCYCALVKALPEGETLSPTYCHCSKAFVKTLWEEVLGRPVEVELLASALAGSQECEFRITIG